MKQFQFDLLSVGKLLDDMEITVKFFPNYCILQDQSTKEVLAMACKSEGLYKLNSGSFNREYILRMNFSFLGVNNDAESCNWHSRLGHVSNEVVSHIPSISFSCNKADCEICHLAKQCRTSFQSSSIKTKRILQLIHVDLWGPYHLNV